MIKSALEWLRSQAIISNGPLKIDGRDYGANLVPICTPQRGSVGTFSSLEALVSYLKSLEACGEPDILQIVVDKDRAVSIMTLPDPLWQRRDVLARAVFDRKIFEFDKWMPIEYFVISVQCLFVDSDAKKGMIDFVSTIVGNEVTTVGDDGVSQSVTVRRSTTGRAESGKFDSMVKLQPIRTFSDVSQPASMFLLRLKQQEKGLPLVALFEADGGAWRDDACHLIAQWLRSNTSITVIG
jgi:hypothetical protein